MPSRARSFWVVCLALLHLVLGAPIQTAGIQLTEKTFPALITTGTWFIEFYSPYCGHCKHFAPTWKKFVSDHAPTYEAQGIFHFAQVDCVANGDLCAAQNIGGYPTLWLYVDGKQDQEFTGSRDAQSIEVWLEPNLPAPEEERVIDPVVPVAHPEEAIKDKQDKDKAPKKKQQAQQEDGRFNVQQPPNRRVITPNEAGQVVKLDSKGLEELVSAESDQGPAFVKFFAPWCSHCRALAPTWADLAKSLQSKINVIEVDCVDSASKDACRKYKVAGYPTLIFFSEGEHTEYSGSRSLSQLEAFSLKAAAAQGVRDISPYELSEISLAEDAYFVYLYPKDTPQAEISLIHEASRTLVGSAHVYKSSSLDHFNRYALSPAIPYLLTFKAHVLDVPYTTLKLDIPRTKEYLSAYLNALRMPSLGQLTEETSKAYLENMGEPLVALVPLSNRKHTMVHAHLQTLRKIVDDWIQNTDQRKAMGKEVIFAWIDADEWSSWLKDMYSHTVSSDPAVIIAYPRKKQYWSSDADGQAIPLKDTAIFQILNDIASGKAKARSSFNWIEKIAFSIGSMAEALFSFIANHPLLALLIVLGSLGGFVFIIWRTIQDDVRPKNTGYVVVPRGGPKAD